MVGSSRCLDHQPITNEHSSDTKDPSHVGRAKIVLQNQKLALYHLPQNSMRQESQRTRCPPPSGTIQLPQSGLTQGTAPVDSSPLRVSSVRHVSKARLSLPCSLAAAVLPSVPPSLAVEYLLSRNSCPRQGKGCGTTILEKRRGMLGEQTLLALLWYSLLSCHTSNLRRRQLQWWRRTTLEDMVHKVHEAT